MWVFLALSPLSPASCPATGEMEEMSGSPAAFQDYEALLRMKATSPTEQKDRGPWHLSAP